MAAREIDFERELNPDQLAAVTHGEGPQLVLAGAGSGKTRVITYRIAWLVLERGVEAGRIAAVTFTNKAAQEMKGRVEELLGLYPLPTFVGTFHRYALRLLRAYGERVGLARDFAIFDAADQKSLIKKALLAEKIDPASFRPQAVLAAISGAKNRLLTPAEYERQADDFWSQHVARAYRRYQTLLRGSGGVDFDDMIALSVMLLRGDGELRERVRRRARYLLVDEFQDTNHAQLSLIHEIAGAEGNLTAVGDEDQGIYRWRGAELENILRFERHFPGAVERKLERNYRSTQNVLDAAGAVVAHNRGRRGKSLWTDVGAGEPITLYRARDEQDEARWVLGALAGLEAEHGLSAMAILVRTNAQTRAFEEELLRRRMPYTLVGGVRFYERAEIKDLLAYLRLLRNPHDAFSFARVVNQPPRGIGKTTLDRLEKRAEELDKAPWEVLVEDRLEGLPKRGATALRGFRGMIETLRVEAEELPLPALLRRLIELSGYAEHLAKGDADDQARLENVQELVSAGQEFTEQHGYGSDVEDLLTAFLDHVSLVSDLDAWGDGRGISLMTLHSAKGLEFAVVAVAGLEEGLLPHFNASQSDEDLEEERRLLYVGMTRAEKKLFLSCCRRRRIAGQYQNQTESPFLAEVPAELLEVEHSPELVDRSQAASIYSFFGRGTRAGGGTAEIDPADEVQAEPERRSAGGLRKGCRVRHASLGVGRVLAMEGSGDDARLTVYFDGLGRRKLVARYANLEVV